VLILGWLFNSPENRTILPGSQPLREGQWHFRAYRTKNPLSSTFFVCWSFVWGIWGMGFKLAVDGMLGLFLSLLGIKKMLSSYRALKNNLDERLLAKTVSSFPKLTFKM